jgi:lipid-binding SYLF domain-containing protein
MQKRFTSRLITGLLATVLIAAGLMTASAQNSKEREIKNAAKTSSKATKALNQLMKIPAESIPEGLLKDAKAIAVFPNVLKAAFGFGGSGGKGLISRRTKDGWSAPAAFKLASGSVGFQIGASSTDIVLLFMTDGSLKNLLEDRFEIGAEASAAGGPVGRTAKASTDAQLQAAILSYSKSKGLFAGVSLNGAVISPDNDANQALYSFNAKELLTGENKVPIASIPPATKNFQQAITRYSK